MYVVSPEWITESVAAGKKLNESRFSIMKVAFGIQGLFITMKFYVESFQQKRPAIASTAASGNTDNPPLPNPCDSPIATTNLRDEHIAVYDENMTTMEGKEVEERGGLLVGSEEVEVSAINKEYLPEKVFSKSRFHVMGEIKRSLQELVTREYAKQHSLPPSRLSTFPVHPLS